VAQQNQASETIIEGQRQMPDTRRSSQTDIVYPPELKTLADFGI
jgi:hypothetical protein